MELAAEARGLCRNHGNGDKKQNGLLPGGGRVSEGDHYERSESNGSHTRKAIGNLVPCINEEII